MRIRSCIVAALALHQWPLAAIGAQVGDSTRVMTIRISLAVRQLWVVDARGDTLLAASVAGGSDRTLIGDDRSWTFRTPVGVTRVVAKQERPVWVPPDWHYIEVAKGRALAVARLHPDTPAVLSHGRTLLVRWPQIGIIGPDRAFQRLPAAEELVFDGTLFIPPFGTEQRQIQGTLGAFRLLLANGVGLHGTDVEDSIGKAVTHGCIRLRDQAIAWLHENVPLGTMVVIY